MPTSSLLLAVAGTSIVAVVAIVLFVRARSEGARLKATLAEKEDEIHRRHAELEVSTNQVRGLQGSLTSLEETVKRLSPYQQIIDATAEATKLRAAAEEALRRASSEAVDSVARAQAQAAFILTEAKTKAENTAGEALKAQADFARLQEVARAMQNVVEGYGDKYLIPTRSLIDDLAADYDHTKAGRDLTAALEKTRLMIESNQAAESDLAEPVRRTSAIRFMIDAFNGKVEAILTRAKTNNVGTLTQELRDAFSLVNHDGAAFRSRITPAFRDARLAELRALVVLNELREQEREEQRRIKEQMREEEKARREYERAIREAEKEEEQIRKAMEKARTEIARASEAQRAKYEAQLAELQGRLAEAEAKNKRALSMAEQTRRGNVYIISNVGAFGEDVVKVGLTRRLEPLDRIKELGDASVPFSFDVHAFIYSEDAPALERELHMLLDEHRVNRVNYRKEFFRVSVAQLRDYVAKKGIQVQFTMVAQAREFRESKALAAMSPEERAVYRLKQQAMPTEVFAED